MSYLGQKLLNDYLTWSVTTHVATTGAANDADANPSFRVYEDQVSTPLLTGSMALLDDANTTGLYSKRVQITAASGFEVGKDYNILTKATVNSVSGNKTDFFGVKSGVVVVGTNNDKTGYSGVVTNNVVVGTNLDKTAYNVTSGTLNYVGTANVVVGSVVLTANTIDDILDEVVEGTLTMRQMLRIFLSKLAGEASGGGSTTINFRDNADSKNRISMTVDVNGNRSAVTLDGS